jgi:hypothetical protein
MSTLKAANIQSTTTGAPTFKSSAGTEIGQLIKAWVNFNGAGTVAIRDDFNVSSITDNGTGTYTVTFSAAMGNANYATLGTIEERGVSVHCSTTDVATQTTTAVNIGTVLSGTSTGFDCQQVNVAVFGA